MKRSHPHRSTPGIFRLQFPYRGSILSRTGLSRAPIPYELLAQKSITKGLTTKISPVWNSHEIDLCGHKRIRRHTAHRLPGPAQRGNGLGPPCSYPKVGVGVVLEKHPVPEEGQGHFQYGNQSSESHSRSQPISG